MLKTVFAILGLTLATVSFAAPMEAPITDPSWNSRSHWTFDTEDALQLSENVTAQIVYNDPENYPGTGWIDNELSAYTTQQGIWEIATYNGGSDKISLSIDHNTSSDPLEIMVQIAYLNINGSIDQSPYVDIDGAIMTGYSFSTAYEEILNSGGWYVYTSTWSIGYTPQVLNIDVIASINGTSIDQIVVDTNPVPEPATISLMILGSAGMLLKRRKH